MNDYLDSGHTLVADNLALADLFLERKIHNVITLRKFVKRVPRKILDEKKIEKGNIKEK